MAHATSATRPPVATSLDDLSVVVDYYEGSTAVDVYDAADLEEPIISLPARDMAALVVMLGEAVGRALGTAPPGLIVDLDEAALAVVAGLKRYLTHTPTSPEGGTP